MVNNPKALWDNCLSLIKDNVTEQQYKAWFEPIVFEKYDEDFQTLLVQVPSMYVYEYLEQYYVNLLSKVLTRCFGQNVQLKYRVVTDKQHGINTVVEGESLLVWSLLPLRPVATSRPRRWTQSVTI